MTTQGELPDIVERLRTLQDHYSTSGQLGIENRKIFAEAADLIERLRATPPGSPLIAEREAVAWQFRQRSGVSGIHQRHAPWCDWCGIERETYEQYMRKPNELIQVRALSVITPSPSPTEREGE